MTKTKTTNLARWTSRHHALNIDERYALGDAIAADKLTASEAYDYLAEHEVDLTPSQVRECVTVREALTPSYFAQWKSSFQSWSALYEWAREGAEVSVLNKLERPITVDALRRNRGVKPTRPSANPREQVRGASTSDLVAELNARMDDENVVDQVIDVAVKASARNSKRRSAASGKPLPEDTRVPAVTSVGLEVMADLKDLAQRMRRVEAKAAGLDEVNHDAAVTIFEQDVVPAYGSLSLTVLGARI